MEVHFANQRRTILIPNPIVLESKPPAVLDAGAVRPVFSPDGDHQSDTVTIHYKLSEDAHVLVLRRRGSRVIRGRSHQAKDKVSWNGKVDGRLLPPGTYVARRRRGRSRRQPRDDGEAGRGDDLRYIALSATRVTVDAGGAASAFASRPTRSVTAGRSVRASGFASAPVLKLRARVHPARTG